MGLSQEYHEAMLTDINDSFIGVAYIVVGVEIVRFVWNSEMVNRVKVNPELQKSFISLHQKIMMITCLFALSFLTCGLTHWLKVVRRHEAIAFPSIIPISISVHSVCMVAGLLTAFTLSSSIRTLLTATNALEVTPEGRLGTAEAVLLDVIDNCKESVAVLSLPSLTFVRANSATALYFGNKFFEADIIDFIFEDDRHIFQECVSQLIESHRNTFSSLIKKGGDAEDTHITAHHHYYSKNCDEEAPLLMKKKPVRSSHINPSTKEDKTKTIEYRVINVHDELIWLESTVLLQKEVTNDHMSTTLMLLTRDITDKKAEIDIVKRENAAKLQYITCCAHDLKTPLQSFSSALDLMQSSGLNPDQMDIMNHAEISLSLMSLTISQAMDTSKALMGYELVPKKSTCFLSDLLTTAVIIIESYGREVPLYVSFSSDVRNEIITANEWVWQILLNYLTNACKHTEEGCIHVNVSICTDYPPGRKVASTDLKERTENMSSTTGKWNCTADSSAEKLLFKVVDTGVGVDPLRQDSLFEVFSQAQRGQSAGTGLGLFSVYSRCNRLGGACGVISPNTYPVAEGGGSTFWFAVPYLPVSSKHMTLNNFTRYHTTHAHCHSCQPNGVVAMGIDVTRHKKESSGNHEIVSVSSTSASISPSSSALSDNGGEEEKEVKFPYTAFVVDDVLSIRKLLQRTLKRLGFTRVELFENGKRALDAMKKEVVDVVFMDIQMPIMSGPEAIRRLREYEVKKNRQRQYVIAVSANIEDNLVGNDSFDIQCGKPLREKDIINCLNVLVVKKDI